ncbi:MAG: restriction endonuclease subunit S [Pirellulaceae bacterium]
MATLTETEIGDLVDRVQSWSPATDSNDSEFTYIDLSSVDKDSKCIVNPVRTRCAEAPSRARQLVAFRDVLVSTVRPNLNGVAVVPPELDGATASTGFCVLRPREDKVCWRYLYHWVRSPIFIRDMTRKATGASYPAVSDRIIQDSKIPLPKLEEQKRIAAILDKADAIRRQRQEALDEADILLESSFIHLFGDPVNNPHGWDLVPLTKLTTRITVGIVVKPASYYVDDGVPALRSLNVRPNRIAKENLVYCSTKDNEHALKKTRIWKGDVLLVRSGQPGTAAVVPDELDGVNAIDILIVSPISDSLNSHYLSAFFNSEAGKRMALGEQRGQIQKHLNVTSLKDVSLPVPPMPEQERFDAIVRKIGDTQAQLESARLEADALFNSLVQRAFKGEL